VDPLNAAVAVATRVANGELDGSIHIERDDELGKLMQALKNMTEKLSKIVTEVRASADSVGSAAKQISAGNNDLSQRTQEQASALEETASSMEEMTSTTKQNADNARQANQLAAGTRDQASQGGQVVSNAVEAMSEINTSSKKIADIIGVIDEIAFQTNLLALNAAVEAARAGEQGRGFAVVASEVRNLAQRSATAAKEIKGLISDSVEKVHSGSKLVDASGETLSGIVSSVKKVSDIVAEIAAASQEQSSGIEQVNKAIMQMDEVTQQNAALVEQAAAASKSMEDQAQKMVELMSFFRTGGHASVSAALAASRPVRAPLKERLVAASSGQRAAATRKVTASRGNGNGEWTEF
jgi:methyl-accepting chemotaxis protein-1 (serine sensor receptor)